MVENALLKVENAGKRFGGNWAVRNVSMTINKGEIVAVIGPNGAGKTTLFNMITNFLRPTEGKVYVKGKNVTTYSPDKMCNIGVTRTFQIVKPFPDLTVLENVIVGALKDERNVDKARERALKYIKIVGLEKFKDQQADSLPIGNRKRLELARALATEPEIIMLDEVMGGLNDEETEEVMDLIAKLNRKGLTILLIEHNMHAINTLAGKIIVLSYGEKIAEGTPSEVTSNELVIEAYLGKDD